MTNSDMQIKWLTKREHFAGLAMQGLIAEGSINTIRSEDRYELVKRSVRLADSLLNALKT